MWQLGAMSPDSSSLNYRLLRFRPSRRWTVPSAPHVSPVCFEKNDQIRVQLPDHGFGEHLIRNQNSNPRLEGSLPECFILKRMNDLHSFFRRVRPTDAKPGAPGLTTSPTDDIPVTRRAGHKPLIRSEAPGTTRSSRKKLLARSWCAAKGGGTWLWGRNGWKKNRCYRRALLLPRLPSHVNSDR